MLSSCPQIVVTLFVSLVVTVALINPHYEGGVLAAAMTDKATGIDFANRNKHGLEVFGVGVRKKGPIKVYSVAMYGDPSLKERLAGISRSSDNARQILQMGAHDGPASFVLDMNMKVGAEKIGSAIAESVSPRYSGSEKELAQLKSLIVKGVMKKGAAAKGTKLQFDCTTNGIAVAVDGKSQGQIPSTLLANAFCDVYLDDRSVSPALRESCLANCCAP